MLHICPVCQKTKDWRTNEIIYVDNQPQLKHKWKFLKRACKTCIELMYENVNISCDKCDSITMSPPEFFASKWRNDCAAGTFLWVKSCPKCDDDHEFKGMYVIQYWKVK